MNTENKSEHSAVAEAEQNVKPDLAAWLMQILNKGEHYAGVVIGADGLPSHHLVLMPDDLGIYTWNAASAWAAKAGGDLPTRQEQALLFANLKGKFEQRAYWSNEQHAAYADYAWYQNFNGGYQNDGIKSASLRARAVRRLTIS
jgi:hypothetical protein